MRLFFSPRFAEHTPPPGHPERPERAEVFARVAAEFRQAGGTVIEPTAASVSDLARVHRQQHIDLRRRHVRASRDARSRYVHES